MAANKKTKVLARQLFKLSLANGQVSTEQVAGVLGWVEKHAPRQSLSLLKIYQRMISTELAQSQAMVSHAGAVDTGLLARIEQAMTKKYQRPISARATPDASLIAGIRVRLGDDVYESSVANQLASLSV